jgi:ATP-binding cassette subfamily C protein CydC
MKRLLRLARLMGAFKLRIALGVALALAAVLANVGLLALSSWFIASMAIAGSLGLAFNYALPAAGIRALAIFRAACRYAERLANHDTTFRLLASLRLWFFKAVEPLAPARLAAYRSGDLLARIRSDIDELDDFYVRGTVPALVAILSMACILPFLWSFDPRFAWIDGLGLVAAGALSPALLAARAARSGREKLRLSAELRASIVEEVTGMAELVALGAAGSHAKAMDALAESMEERGKRLGSLEGTGEAAFSALASLASWGTALVSASLVATGALSPADMAMLIVLVAASFESVSVLPNAIQKAGKMDEAAKRLFEILDAEPVGTVLEPPAGQGTVLQPLGTVLEFPEPPKMLGLAVRNLRFSYVPEGPSVFDGLSLEVEAGEMVGVAGPSGSGKSSLLRLLLRFWDYQDGSIELRSREALWSRDLRALSPQEARSLFSVLPQTPFLFHSSIRDNLLVAARPGGIAGPGEIAEPAGQSSAQEGSPDAEEDQRLLEALDAAGLSGLMSRQPEGLDSIVGETGKALSSGEARRLALARAFLKDAPIYLLDEPTESLDDVTAELLLESIARRLAGKTVVMISHRERDFRVAGRVIRLGRVGLE